MSPIHHLYLIITTILRISYGSRNWGDENLVNESHSPNSHVWVPIKQQLEAPGKCTKHLAKRDDFTGKHLSTTCEFVEKKKTFPRLKSHQR